MLMNNLRRDGNIKVEPVPRNQLCPPDRVYLPKNIRREYNKIKHALIQRERMGELQIKGLLLEGAKGTGKTITAQALAVETDAVFIPILNLANEAYIHQVFATARDIPGDRLVILFSDELDSVSSRDKQLNPYEKRATNALLTELGGIEKNQNILFVATTNMPDEIDEALRRPGRLDYEINFVPPDEDGRIKILEIHAMKYATGFEFNVEDLPEIAKVTPGFTGADLRKLLQEAMYAVNYEIEIVHRGEVLKERRGEGGKVKVLLKDLLKARQELKPSAFRELRFFETQKTKDSIGGYSAQIKLLEHIYNNIDSGSIGLIYGPPGVGKTDVPAIIAKSSGLNVLVFNAGQFLDKYVGEPNRKIARALRIAENTGYTVVILDELQAIVQRQGEMNHLSDITHYLLAELSQPRKSIVILATATRPDRWEQQLIDRFIYKIYFPNPRENDRMLIWEKYLPEAMKQHAKELSRINLNPRRIERVCQKCREFNVNDFAKYKKLAEAMADTKTDEDQLYEEIKKDIGDDTEMFDVLTGE